MGIMDKLKSALFVQKEQSAPAAPELSYAEREARYQENRINAFRDELAKLRKVEIQLSDEPHNRNKEIEFYDLTPKNITKSTNLAKLLDFVALDVESVVLSQRHTAEWLHRLVINEHVLVLRVELKAVDFGQRRAASLGSIEKRGNRLAGLVFILNDGASVSRKLGVTLAVSHWHNAGERTSRIFLFCNIPKFFKNNTFRYNIKPFIPCFNILESIYLNSFFED